MHLVPVTRRMPAVVCRKLIVLRASGFRAALDKYGMNWRRGSIVSPRTTQRIYYGGGGLSRKAKEPPSPEFYCIIVYFTLLQNSLSLRPKLGILKYLLSLYQNINDNVSYKKNYMGIYVQLMQPHLY